MTDKLKLDYRVPYADTDKMGVVYYANYFVYFERFRNELIRQTGLCYKDVEKTGLMFPVIEAFCEYINAAKYDDILQIYGNIKWAKGSRFQIEYEIYCENKKLVTGNTIHNTITMDGKPRRIPDYIKKLVPN
jgi:acyl-CoA thioester hydrolase